VRRSRGAIRARRRELARLSNEEMTMATGDERLAEMIREFQARNEKWNELKAKLIARGDAPVFVSEEVFERIESGARVRSFSLASFNGVRA
jgi:hypothetical protein